MIFRVPAVPNDADRRVFTTIRDSYSRLLPQISEALFSLWELAASSTHDASAPPANSAEILALLRLECICIERSAIVELL
jgi:hypothetical protein